MLQDRRQYPRLAPHSPQLVLLDESKYSLLFDVCEGGLALEGFTAKNPHDVISLEFDLPEGSGCIQAQAEVTWSSESGYRTGLRFLEIPDASRQHLRNWIASTSCNRMAVSEEATGQPVFALNPPPSAVPLSAISGVQQTQTPPPTSVLSMPRAFEYRSQQISDTEQELGQEGNSGHLAAIFIGAVLMSSIAFLMGYYLHAGHSRRAVQTAASADARTATSPSLAPPPTVEVTPAPAKPPLDAPGFVLQVAAMANEANANALSVGLGQKNLSAFVLKQGNDHLFRVVVGPFKDADSATDPAAELKRQGFRPMLRSWTPE